MATDILDLSSIPMYKRATVLELLLSAASDTVISVLPGTVGSYVVDIENGLTEVQYQFVLMRLRLEGLVKSLCPAFDPVAKSMAKKELAEYSCLEIATTWFLEELSKDPALVVGA